jgi:uncharacterized protein YlxW (UPF0749 family)
VKVNEDDPEQLDFTFMNYVDPKGVIPTWTKKSRGLSCLEAALTLKNIVEQLHNASQEKQSKNKEQQQQQQQQQQLQQQQQQLQQQQQQSHNHYQRQHRFLFFEYFSHFFT